MRIARNDPCVSASRPRYDLARVRYVVTTRTREEGAQTRGGEEAMTMNIVLFFVVLLGVIAASWAVV